MSTLRQRCVPKPGCLFEVWVRGHSPLAPNLSQVYHNLNWVVSMDRGIFESQSGAVLCLDMLVSRHVPFAFAREHSLLQNRTLSRAISSQFPPESIIGVQEEVQLREQDFGNFQVGVFVRARAR
eukprot:scaffold123963_cov17-Tisochrysis_lutea.AAC.1